MKEKVLQYWGISYHMYITSFGSELNMIKKLFYKAKSPSIFDYRTHNNVANYECSWQHPETMLFHNIISSKSKYTTLAVPVTPNHVVLTFCVLIHKQPRKSKVKTMSQNPQGYQHSTLFFSIFSVILFDYWSLFPKPLNCQLRVLQSYFLPIYSFFNPLQSFQPSFSLEI